MKFYILALLTIFIYACSGSDRTEKNYTQYLFVFYDSTGTDTVAYGNLRFGSLKQKTEGFYTVYKKNSTLPFSNDTSAVLEGSFDNIKKSLWLNMNPKLADNNIFVTAVLLNDIFEGDWMYSTMKGIKEKGKFYARKK
jgi:hypothetical protein